MATEEVWTVVRKLQEARPAYRKKFPLLEELAAELADRLILFIFGSYARGQETSVFHSLAAGGVIPSDVAEAMADTARFRNLLVHLYRKVDQARIRQTLPQRIETLTAFSQAIVQHLGLDSE